MLGRNGDFCKSRFFRGRGTPLPAAYIPTCGGEPLSPFTRQERRIRTIKKVLYLPSQYAYWYAYREGDQVCEWQKGGGGRGIRSPTVREGRKKKRTSNKRCSLAPTGAGISENAEGTSKSAVLEKTKSRSMHISGHG